MTLGHENYAVTPRSASHGSGGRHQGRLILPQSVSRLPSAVMNPPRACRNKRARNPILATAAAANPSFHIELVLKASDGELIAPQREAGVQAFLSDRKKQLNCTGHRVFFSITGALGATRRLCRHAHAQLLQIARSQFVIDCEVEHR